MTVVLGLWISSLGLADNFMADCQSRTKSHRIFKDASNKNFCRCLESRARSEKVDKRHLVDLMEKRPVPEKAKPAASKVMQTCLDLAMHAASKKRQKEDPSYKGMVSTASVKQQVGSSQKRFELIEKGHAYFDKNLKGRAIVTASVHEGDMRSLACYEIETQINCKVTNWSFSAYEKSLIRSEGTTRLDRCDLKPQKDQLQMTMESRKSKFRVVLFELSEKDVDSRLPKTFTSSSGDRIWVRPVETCRDLTERASKSARTSRQVYTEFFGGP